MHKTDEKGVFKEWTPRPERFREREYSRVKVGVPDADGMDSWEHWRAQHPDRPGHGNLPAHPSVYPTTSHDVVFRGPISQPREVAPVDQNYDMTTVNDDGSELPAPTGTEGWVTGATEAAPVPPPTAADSSAYFVRDGVEYVAVPVVQQRAPVVVVPSGEAQVYARVPAGPSAAYAPKDAHLLDALRRVVGEMHASEAEYSQLRRQLGSLNAAVGSVKTRAAESQVCVERGWGGGDRGVGKGRERERKRKRKRGCVGVGVFGRVLV